ncbi:5'-nucleotidase domain-containing protein 3 [Trichonephila inaurata madagascariensis]|uniref:5'-nucleotidase domain-containing protein 3 n=1 Tax=Trichonephila inaurata madagascariensis TaxID=2747483 RepID=A0A8X7C9S9_9ARAC|nr:5'-nucleotidase domain-containing protein 3 [Trichonephila inaurata madagascariensis]
MQPNFLKILFNTNINSVVLNRKSVFNLYTRQFVREIARQRTFKENFDTSFEFNEKSLDDVDHLDVFANNELKLGEIDVYGFDYDYTLAIYKESLQILIYQLGKEKLVDKLKYPPGIKDLPYQPGFAIRGLHYDMQKGILMKLDAFHQIQFTSVYRGLTPLTKKEIIDIYKGSHISQELIRGSSRQGPRMRQLNDLFSVPEICLLSTVTEYFIRNKIPHHPEILSHDVQGAVRRIHPTMHAMLEKANIGGYLEEHKELAQFLQSLQKGGKKMFLITNSPFKFVFISKLLFQGPRMRQLNDLFSVPEICLLSTVTEYFIRNKIPHHPEILSHDVQGAVRRIHPTMHAMLEKANIGGYLEEHKELAQFLQSLQKGGKKMFLITNSPFKFVDRGMTFMLGPCWRNYFDIVIVEAKKPLFFANQSWPFRIYDVEANCTLWEEVKSLEKGRVYIEGNLSDLQRMTKWYGKNVLYVGDQIYSDLADLTLHHGWRTGAIIYELSDEIRILNRPDYKKAVSWLKSFQSASQQTYNKDSEYIRREYESIRNFTKAKFNRQFGSIFRTHDNPTYFSRRLFRYSDIYTSQITNLSRYPLNHIFYPKRFALPHEK